MSSFMFALLIIGAGIVAYAINHALKPQGWTTAQPKPELAS
jgi:hypothetical protein